MIEYPNILETISSSEERELSKAYFETYWLTASGFRTTWLPVMRRIFDVDARCLPEMMFKSHLLLKPVYDGEIFLSEENLLAFENWMSEAGDSRFVVIENENVSYVGWLPVRFIYPADISWQEIMSGGIIGSEHVKNGLKDYFVFGDSGKWGLYVGGSYSIKKPTGWYSLSFFGLERVLSESFDSTLGGLRRLQECDVAEDDLPGELRRNYF